MADSKRLVALKRLTEHLVSETAVPTYRGRLKFGDKDPIPMLSILEDPDPDRFPRRAGGDDGVRSPMQLETWHLLVQGWAEDDPENPTDPAHELLARVKMALAKINQGHGPFGEPPSDSYNLGGIIAGITMEPGTVRPPMEQPSERAFFWLRIALQFVEDVNDPFNLD